MNLEQEIIDLKAEVAQLKSQMAGVQTETTLAIDQFSRIFDEVSKKSTKLAHTVNEFVGRWARA